MLKIKSITDVITNSSSEVFIIKPIKNRKSDIMNKIYKLCEVFNLNPSDMFTVEIAKSKGDDGYLRWNKGDIIIKEKDDNSIPYPLLGVFEGLDHLDDTIKEVLVERC